MTSKKQTLRRPVRLALIAAIIAAALALTAGAYYVIHHWNSIFDKRFQTNDSIKAQMAGLVDEPIASSTRNGVTLSVEQTLTDGNEFYAVISIRLPEDFDMSQLIVANEDKMAPETLALFASYDEATGHWYTGPSTAAAEWFQGELSPEVLEGLTVAEIEGDPGRYRDLLTGGSFLPKQVDVAEHTVYYLLMTDLRQKANSYTVWFEKVTMGDFDGEALIDGPFYVTWTPSYDASLTVETTIMRDGREIGTMILSPMTLTLDVPDLFDTMDHPPQGDALEEFYHIASGVLTDEEADAMEQDPVGFLKSHKSIDDYLHISIQYTDGSSHSVAANCESEYDDAAGTVYIRMRAALYDELGSFLDLRQVQSVTVNDVTIPVGGAAK